MNLISEKDQLIIAYSFDQECKRLIGSFEYNWVAGTGLAANSTDIQPPIFKTGKIPVFDETAQKWNLVEDHRGKTVYSTADQSKSKIDYVGEIKDGFTPLEPTSIFETWTGKAWLDQRTDEEKEALKLASYPALTTRQFHLTLVMKDLEDTVRSAIDAIEDQKRKAIINIEFNKADNFKRTGTSMLFMQEQMNMSNDELNELWEFGLAIPD